jgi:hypothetical protein
MLLPPALAEAFSKARNACFVGVKKRSKTLHNATETPRMARNDELFSAENTIMTVPVTRTRPIMSTMSISWLILVFLVLNILLTPLSVLKLISCSERIIVLGNLKIGDL